MKNLENVKEMKEARMTAKYVFQCFLWKKAIRISSRRLCIQKTKSNKNYITAIFLSPYNNILSLQEKNVNGNKKRDRASTAIF